MQNPDYLPSTVLAVGYHRQFVAPVMAALAAGATLKVKGETLDAGPARLEIRIPTPSTLRHPDAGAAPAGLLPVTLEADRPLGLWLDPAGAGDAALLVDVPRNLGSLAEAIELCGLGDTDQLAAEVERFRNVLADLCADETQVRIL